MFRRLWNRFLWWESSNLMKISAAYAEKGGFKNIKKSLTYLKYAAIVMPNDEDGKAVRSYMSKSLRETAEKYSAE